MMTMPGLGKFGWKILHIKPILSWMRQQSCADGIERLPKLPRKITNVSALVG
jgi:hypothetical protein